MMDTPICDFVKDYEKKEPLRLHMPGHKGMELLGIEKLDITEITGADVLYNAKGIIKESQDIASSFFGSAKTLYSTEGSSLSIRAMLYLTLLYAERRKEKCVIFAARNAHNVFVTAAALLNIDVEWIFSENEESMISCEISPDHLERRLDSSTKKPTAVYITSPDYLGNIADIKGISEVCKKRGCLLLVDNAHGAYLNFLKENSHPLALGADMCCDSAHKTLPVLTGGGYLHISKNAPDLFKDQAQRAMSVFASTSPSYLILQSLDLANRYFSDGYREKLEKASEKYRYLKLKLKEKGYVLIGNEALKLTIETKSYGYTGEEFARLLEEKNIFVEFYDPDLVTMMLPVDMIDDDLHRLEDALLCIPRSIPKKSKKPKIASCKRVMSATKAVFSDSKTVPIQESLNKIAAYGAIGCPPAIPIVSCGELIDENAVEAMRYYGIDEVQIVEEFN